MLQNHVKSVLSIAAVAATLTSTGVAAPLWNMDFEGASHVVGSVPNTTPPNTGGVSSNPTFAGSTGAGTVLVQNGFTDTDTSNTLGSKVAVLSKTAAGSAQLQMQGDPADEVSTGTYTLSFDWIEDSLPAGSSSFFIGMTNQARSKSLSSIFFDLGEPAGNIRSGNSVNFGATLGTATRGAAHHLDWVINLSEANPALFSQVYLDGNLIATHQRDPVGVPHDGASAFGSFTISHSAASVGTIAIDNIVLQAGSHVVPEPASALALVAGFGALAIRRRK